MADFCFLFYVGDWLGGTQLLSREHKGAYMDLLMAQFNNGHLSKEDIRLILGETDLLYLWPKLKSKFILDSDGLFFNEKLDIEKFKRKKFVDSRTKNLDHKKDHMGVHMGNQMEKEKEKEKVVKKEDEKETIPYEQIIEDLNTKLGLVKPKGYKHTTQKTKDAIKARFNDGFKLEDFFTVHNKKVKEWKNTEHAKFLRPETLYSNKFEGYLNQLDSTSTQKVKKENEGIF